MCYSINTTRKRCKRRFVSSVISYIHCVFQWQNNPTREANRTNRTNSTQSIHAQWHLLIGQRFSSCHAVAEPKGSSLGPCPDAVQSVHVHDLFLWSDSKGWWHWFGPNSVSVKWRFAEQSNMGGGRYKNKNVILSSYFPLYLRVFLHIVPIPFLPLHLHPLFFVLIFPHLISFRLILFLPSSSSSLSYSVFLFLFFFSTLVRTIMRSGPFRHVLHSPDINICTTFRRLPGSQTLDDYICGPLDKATPYH